VFLSTGEIKELRESISVAELEKIEAEYTSKRIDPETARELYYESFKKEVIEKSLGSSPNKPNETEEAVMTEDADSSDLSEFPLPLWKAPKVKTPPLKSKTTVP
jgi:hypothetical protein